MCSFNGCLRLVPFANKTPITIYCISSRDLLMLTLRDRCNDHYIYFAEINMGDEELDMMWFLMQKLLSGYAAYNIKCVVYCTPSLVKWILILQLLIHFLRLSWDSYFNFCQTNTGVSLLVQHLIPSGSIKMESFWFF